MVERPEFIEDPIYGRVLDCVAFSTMSECVSETGERELHPASFCLHPGNGGPTHGCDLFDETGRLIKGKECQFRVREGDPRAPEVRKIAVWPDLYHSDEDYPPPEDE